MTAFGFSSAEIATTGRRIALGWQSLRDDMQRWPFDLVVNVLLASPLVPRIGRAALLRALGMQLSNFDIYPRCSFRSTKLKVGRGAVINAGCHFDNNTWVEIGARVQVAMNVTFVTSGHKLGSRERRAGPLELKPIVVGDGTSIGAGVTILPGVTIGEGCVIGAGSVVRSDCAPNGLYSGVPAERIDRPRGNRASKARTAAVDDGSGSGGLAEAGLRRTLDLIEAERGIARAVQNQTIRGPA
jgi:maltose O-acetyltransferase